MNATNNRMFPYDMQVGRVSATSLHINAWRERLAFPIVGLFRPYHSSYISSAIKDYSKRFVIPIDSRSHCLHFEKALLLCIIHTNSRRLVGGQGGIATDSIVWLEGRAGHYKWAITGHGSPYASWHYSSSASSVMPSDIRGSYTITVQVSMYVKKSIRLLP